MDCDGYKIFLQSQKNSNKRPSVDSSEDLQPQHTTSYPKYITKGPLLHMMLSWA